MRKLSILVGFLVILLVASACGGDATDTEPVASSPIGAQVASGDPSTAPGISVSGIGEVSGVPDTLSVSLGISLVRPNVSDAVNAAAERADQLIAALADHGVAESDMKTANYSVYPEYDYTRDERRLVGYRVTNTLTVKIRDIDSAGAILDAATAAGGDDATVNGVSFSLEDNEELITAAREAAWQNAKAKAEQLASLAGVSLGSPVTITESFSTEPPVIQAPAVEAGADFETPVMAGEEVVTVQLTVVFAIVS